MLIREISYLFQKEIQLEFRQRKSLAALILYVISTVFICYLSFKQIINVPTWNALFWIIILFATFNAVSNSFSKETSGTQLYLYSIASPQSVIISKIIYNGLLMLVLASISIVFYMIFIGYSILENADWGMFFLVLMLGSLGLAFILTMIAAIASKTNNGFGITAILGFPVIIPFLITLIRASKNALDGIQWSASVKYIIILLAIKLIILTLSYLLFPYLWRE